MLAEIDHDCELSGDVESLVDSGAACHAWPCKVKPGSSQAGTCLTATGTPIESQNTKEVKFLLFDVHGKNITVTAVFELLPVRRAYCDCEPTCGNEQRLSRSTASQVQWCVSRSCVCIVGLVSLGG